MKNILTILFTILFFFVIASVATALPTHLMTTDECDVIVMKDGSELRAKIVMTNAQEVIFTDCYSNSHESQTRLLSKVASINYEDGRLYYPNVQNSNKEITNKIAKMIFKVAIVLILAFYLIGLLLGISLAWSIIDLF